jgi:DNA-3-methyladenine glycosylase
MKTRFLVAYRPVSLNDPAAPAERRRLAAILRRPPAEAAPALLGQILVRPFRGRALAARIVETEAYLGEGDPAAHAFRGRTARTEPLWGPPGTIYVYFVYGMHHCLNLAVDREGVPGCVLIRAAEPLDHLPADACRGPGRLCRTLRLRATHGGAHVFDAASPLWLREAATPRRVAVSPRVGITRAADWPLRFFDPDSAAVSGRRWAPREEESASPSVPRGRSGPRAGPARTPGRS